VRALTFLEGAAYKYMETYVENIQNGTHSGLWATFEADLKAAYRQHDKEEGAKKELDAFFKNKDLASRNFIKYAEQFCMLGRLSGYNDVLLINKLRNIVSTDMRQVLVGVFLTGAAPTNWVQFLEVLMNIYKELHPDRAQGAIFGKKSGGEEVPMEVDSTERKGKGKQKQANSVEQKKSKKWYLIHKSDCHNTKDCRKNPKNKKDGGKQEEKPRSSDLAKGNSGGKKYKKVRVIKMTDDSRDSESEAEAPPPKPSKSKGKKKEEVNTMHAVDSGAFIEEIENVDEHPAQASASTPGF
jgi:hypothetical protein